MRSIRFRLTALYSSLLFGLAAVMVAGLYAVLYRRLNKESLYVTYDEIHPVPGGYQVTRRELLDQYRLLEHLANTRSLDLLRAYSLTALALLFVSSLVIGWLVAGRVLAPIGRITAVARDIGATDLTRRIDLRGPTDELKELADTFDAMLARIDEAFEGQQRFIQEASHELRNPLAVIRTNLDVVLADPDPDPVELRRVAELVRGTAARMSHLVDDLLVYARRGAPAHDIGPVGLGEVVAEAAAEFAAPAAARSLRVEVAADEGVVVVGDRLALRQAFTNLVANAVRLAPAGSTVVLAAGTDGPQRQMSVADQGPGIAAEHRSLVFQRFWRGDGTTGRHDGRSGLGLAIVEQIVRDHGGRVTLTANAAGGSTFVLSFGPDSPASFPAEG
ncbi:MAG: sensor histidine kinase [Acidimicrobiales bacterium]